MISRLVCSIAAFIALTALPTQATTAIPTLKWPALRFNFTALRSSMEVSGQKEFSVYAAPVVSNDSDKLLYNSVSTFKEDEALLNYTLIDGVSYISTTLAGNTSIKCLGPEASKVPSINSIVAAINDAVAVSSISEAVKCSSGDLFKVSVGGKDFAMCASGPSGFSLHGTDTDIAVEYLETDIDIHPSSVNAATHNCAATVLSSPVTSLGKSLLTGRPISSDARSLKAAFDFNLSFQGDSSCSCKSKPRPCIFIHGLGVKQDAPKNENSYANYWGDHLKDHAPCCSSIKFTHLNTVNNTWVDPNLQRKVCSRVLSISKTSKGSVIKDTIIATHSMGNLMLAGALANGECSLDSSSTWVGIAGPMMGSMASDFVQDSCAGEANAVWQEVSEIAGRCPPNKALKFLAYAGGDYSSKRLDAAYAAAQKTYRKNVYALMCGKSYAGIATKYQAEFWALGSVIPHKSGENDGMVEFKSCAAGFPESKFGDNYLDRFYAAKLNHYDLSFRAGDSMLSAAKMPMKWFECLL